MRLTCPNCAADYEVPDGMVPAAGRHVQCTVCHTRWFVAGAPRSPMSEDQILRRLETWSSRPRPVAVPAPAAAEAAPEEVAAPDAAAEAAPPPAIPAPPPRSAGPAKPAERPTVAQPAGLTAAPVAPPAPAQLRPAPRLELSGEAALRPASEAPQSSRFGTGLLLILLLSAMALATYLYREPIAAQIPEAAPALAAYGTRVDALRADVDDRLEPLRRAVGNKLQ